MEDRKSQLRKFSAAEKVYRSNAVIPDARLPVEVAWAKTAR